jgi:hypothetical protein
MKLTDRGWIVVWIALLLTIIALIAGVEATGWLGPHMPLDQEF